MEGDADGLENATETDTLVNNESEISEDPYERAQETSTLLREMPGPESGAEVDGMDDSKHFEPKATSHPHPYHMKNKYTFRSDSVYSDVIPMSASQQSHHTKTAAETRDKSGSLSSLKAKESKSKWVTLKKKLGKLNSHSHSQSSSSEKQTPDEKDATPQPDKSLQNKRSLFQRAKTMSMIQVHRSSKDKDESHPKKVVVQEKPKELFNVGGEMNMIPLELLIDVNDLNIQN